MQSTIQSTDRFLSHQGNQTKPEKREIFYTQALPVTWCEILQYKPSKVPLRVELHSNCERFVILSLAGWLTMEIRKAHHQTKIGNR